MKMEIDIDTFIINGLSAKLTKVQIADALNLSPSWVSRKAIALGLTKPGAWADWEIEVLKREWNDTDKSATDISLLLHNKSRNAVIGKAHRLGLARRAPAGNKLPKSDASKKRRGRKTPQEGEMIINKKAIAPKRYPADRPLTAKPPISIMELGENTCRAIVGHGGPPHYLAVYCGDQTFADKSFCEAHCTLYFDYDRKRRRA